MSSLGKAEEEPTEEGGKHSARRHNEERKKREQAKRRRVYEPSKVTWVGTPEDSCYSGVHVTV